jgi:diaminohydroxyphosphoribosylaminopyrimidine deaminase/5-amino-6-(5-phosphoribosylamino)uracil reductase
VAGNGIKIIEAGINVTVGVLESECHELNKRFLHVSSKEKTLPNIEMGRKSRRVHFAKSKVRAKPVYITNAYSRQLVHINGAKNKLFLWERNSH